MISAGALTILSKTQEKNLRNVIMLKSNSYRPNINEIISLNDIAVKYHKENNIQKAYKACRKIYELEPAPDILKREHSQFFVNQA